MPIHHDTIEDGQNKTSHRLFSIKHNANGPAVRHDKLYSDRFFRGFYFDIIPHMCVCSLLFSFRRWYPDEYSAAFNKKAAHRALDDIKESIKELKYYRKAVFK